MKTTTLKTFVLALTVFSLFGCKKNSGDDYFVKLKINGNWETWSQNVIGELGPDFANPAKTDFGVTSYNDAQTDGFDLTIQIDGSNFTTGTYESDDPLYYIVIDYFTGISGGTSRFYGISTAPGQPDSKYTVHVTSITNTTLRGTFTGNYLYDDIADESINITEGEFFVRRAR